ncbi:hypothetical protein BDF14DRAFT_1718364 [Spinellus fusiger]|nr:hypothetical protein BDF14DRAFT_1718364 [Spinellus fusiger]
MNSQINFFVLPLELISIVMQHLPLKDLVRIERTSKLIQNFCLYEIQRRIISQPDNQKWSLMVHLGQTIALPYRFDTKTKTISYSVPMDPVHINTMFDHRRQIHCSLLQSTPKSKCNLIEDFSITIEKGMVEGNAENIDIPGKLCRFEASLTRLATPPREENDSKKLLLAPPPLTYTIQVTQMHLPLSTLVIC